jgi:hypothetical protein
LREADEIARHLYQRRQAFPLIAEI